MSGRIFYAIGKNVFESPRIVITFMTIVIAITGLYMFNLRIDSSLDGYLKPGSPALRAYQDFRSIFGDNPKILYGISGSDIFSSGFLNQLKAFQKDIAKGLPFVSGQESLLTLKVIKEQDGRISLYEPFSDIPESWVEKQNRVEEIHQAKMYTNLFFSDSSDFTIVVVSIDPCLSSQYKETDEFEDFSENLTNVDGLNKPVSTVSPCTLTSEETRELVRKAHAIARVNSRDGIKIHVAGVPIYQEFVKQTLMKDAVICVALAGILVLFFLYVFFRRITGVVFPFLIVVFSMTTTMGIMGFMDSPVKIPTSILPTLILVVGIGDSIHVLARYFKALDTGADPKHAISSALAGLGKALFLTSVTTCAGIASFSVADIAPVAALGIYGCIGVGVCFIYTIILLPAFAAICPGSVQGSKKRTLFLSLDSFFESIAVFACTHAKKIVVAGICICLLCTGGILKLKVTHNPMVWLPRDADIRIASETIDKKLGTMASMEVLVGVQNGKKDARLKVLQGMEALRRQIEESPIPSVPVNQIRSVVDVVTLAGKALGRETNINRLPTDPDQLSRDIALMELCAPILLRDFTDHGIQTMRFTIHLPWMDAVVYGPFLDRVRSICNTLFKNGETIVITGRIPLLVTTLNATIGSMVQSYLICGLVISGMMILLMKNATLGMLGMIPNIIPIWLSLGIMGWTGFPLDMYTLLVGSIALGLIVDDTVHFMHYFQACSRQGQSISRTCILTLQTVGPPMLMTTILIVSGALVLLSATMNSLKYFGAAIAGVSFLALVCDLIMVPAIMTLVMGRVNTTKYPRLFLSDIRRKR